MASWNKIQKFVEELAHGAHDLSSDQLVVALCNSDNSPVATDEGQSDLTEISYTYLSARTITTTSSGQTDGTYKLVLQDLTLTSTGGATGPFRYIAIYNDTSTGKLLLGWYDYGSNLTLND